MTGSQLLHECVIRAPAHLTPPPTQECQGGSGGDQQATCQQWVVWGASGRQSPGLQGRQRRNESHAQRKGICQNWSYSSLVSWHMYNHAVPWIMSSYVVNSKFKFTSLVKQCLNWQLRNSWDVLHSRLPNNHFHMDDWVWIDTLTQLWLAHWTGK